MLQPAQPLPPLLFPPCTSAKRAQYDNQHEIKNKKLHARAREDYSLSFTGHTVRTVFTILTQTGFVAPPHIDRTVGVQTVHIEKKIILRKVLAMAVEVSGYHWYAA